MNREVINRKSQRKPVLLAAQCRTMSGLRDRGEISDITSEGCCVKTNSLFFKVGTRVVIRPDGLEGLTGVVRWIVGDKAGVELDSPVYGPVIDHIANKNGLGRPVNLQTY